MGLVIKELTAERLPDINKANDEFIVNEKLIPRYENGRLTYTYVSVPEYRKKYQPESREFYIAHIDNPDRACFIAYLDGEAAGQLLIQHNWNRFAWINDIGVDVNLRRRGIGRALLDRAVEWAKEKRYPGIMLETQDTNTKACRFYE